MPPSLNTNTGDNTGPRFPPPAAHQDAGVAPGPGSSPGSGDRRWSAFESLDNPNNNHISNNTVHTSSIKRKPVGSASLHQQHQYTSYEHHQQQEPPLFPAPRRSSSLSPPPLPPKLPEQQLGDMQQISPTPSAGSDFHIHRKPVSHIHQNYGETTRPLSARQSPQPDFGPAPSPPLPLFLDGSTTDHQQQLLSQPQTFAMIPPRSPPQPTAQAPPPPPLETTAENHFSRSPSPQPLRQPEISSDSTPTSKVPIARSRSRYNSSAGSTDPSISQ